MQEKKTDVKVEANVDKKKEKSRKQANKILWIMFVLLLVIIVAFVSVVIYATYQWKKNAEMQLAKPIIYIYPEEEMAISVRLGNPEKITCSYPTYIDGWDVVAKPDGTLIDSKTNREYYALYWEGKENAKKIITDGFVVRGKDTVSFLEEKLEILGLNEKEAQEFIIYWLPVLQENEYNYIRFASTEEINEYMPLEFSALPNTLIRVLMEYAPLDKYVEIPEQNLTTPEREGFVVVEWGGTKIEI